MIQIEYLPTSSLNAAPYNPRKMPDEQMARLMRGIEAFGLVDPIIVNQATGNIVGGHQRVEAAKRLKLAEVPVVHVSLDREQEKALNLALNKISGEWDLDLLRGILGDLNDGGFDLDLTGFSAGEIDELLAGDTEDDERDPGDPDDAPEVDEQVPPVTQPGDLIILGAHRLLCGDSTKAEDVARLMGGGWRIWSGPTRPTASPTLARPPSRSPSRTTPSMKHSLRCSSRHLWAWPTKTAAPGPFGM